MLYSQIPLCYSPSLDPSVKIRIPDELWGVSLVPPETHHLCRVANLRIYTILGPIICQRIRNTTRKEKNAVRDEVNFSRFSGL